MKPSEKRLMTPSAFQLLPVEEILLINNFPNGCAT